MSERKINIMGKDFIYDDAKAFEEDGHVYCKTCKERVDNEPIKGFNDMILIFPRKCACDRKEEEIEKEKSRIKRINEMITKCYPTDLYKNARLDDFKDNPELHKVGKMYVDLFLENKADKIGLLFYGNVGSGKTHLAAAIANEIMEKYEIQCRMKNFSQIINDLSQGFEVDKNEYISKFTNTQLLILDDLGIQRNTEYATEQLFNVIDMRIQNGNPTIITTNIPLNLFLKSDELACKRIYSRVLDMCVPISVSGEDRRMSKAKEKKRLFEERLKAWEKEFRKNRQEVMELD